MTDTTSLGLTLITPSEDDDNWYQSLLDNFIEPISAHAHAGGGDGTPIGTAGLASAAVTLAKLSAALQSELATGWHELGTTPTETWTYASATTVTVSSNATTRFEIGDKVRFKQGGGYKYGYVFAVAATTLSITGGDDYSVANSAITDIAISRCVSPIDFPDAFNFTPSPSGFSANPTIAYAKFRLEGNFVDVEIILNAAGTSNSTSFTYSAPFTAKTVANAFWGVRCWSAVDNGADVDTATAYIQSASATIVLNKALNVATSWTASSTKKASFNLRYPIA